MFYWLVTPTQINTFLTGTSIPLIVLLTDWLNNWLQDWLTDWLTQTLKMCKAAKFNNVLRPDILPAKLRGTDRNAVACVLKAISTSTKHGAWESFLSSFTLHGSLFSGWSGWNQSHLWGKVWKTFGERDTRRAEGRPRKSAVKTPGRISSAWPRKSLQLYNRHRLLTYSVLFLF